MLRKLDACALLWQPLRWWADKLDMHVTTVSHHAYDERVGSQLRHDGWPRGCGGVAQSSHCYAHLCGSHADRGPASWTCMQLQGTSIRMMSVSGHSCDMTGGRENVTKERPVGQSMPLFCNTRNIGYGATAKSSGLLLANLAHTHNISLLQKRGWIDPEDAYSYVSYHSVGQSVPLFCNTAKSSGRLVFCPSSLAHTHNISLRSPPPQHHCRAGTRARSPAPAALPHCHTPARCRERLHS